jgi:hypothetical protein
MTVAFFLGQKADVRNSFRWIHVARNPGTLIVEQGEGDATCENEL